MSAPVSPILVDEHGVVHAPAGEHREERLPKRDWPLRWVSACDSRVDGILYADCPLFARSRRCPCARAAKAAA